MNSKRKTNKKEEKVVVEKKIIKEEKVVDKKDIDIHRYGKNGLTEEELEEIKTAFELFDDDKSGEITVAELKKALLNLDIDPENKSFQKMLSELDKNGDGNIDLKEFIDMMTAKVEDTNDRKELKEIFDLFKADEDNDFIDISDLKRVCKEVGRSISDEDLNNMIEKADGKDGKIDFEGFYRIMTRKV